jgi:hypothetical protein
LWPRGGASAEELVWRETPEGPGIGVLEFHNMHTFGRGASEIVTFETSRGPLVIEHRRTPNVDCAPAHCADEIEVLEMPAGTAALPPVMIVPELGRDRVVLMEWSGT